MIGMLAGGIYYIKSSGTADAASEMFGRSLFSGSITDKKTYTYGLRGVFRLTDNVIITGGLGTAASPYTLGLK